MQIKWEITPQEASQIITALSHFPFKDVNTLIGKLHVETTKQIAAHEAGSNGNGTEHK